MIRANRFLVESNLVAHLYSSDLFVLTGVTSLLFEQLRP